MQLNLQFYSVFNKTWSRVCIKLDIFAHTYNPDIQEPEAERKKA